MSTLVDPAVKPLRSDLSPVRVAVVLAAATLGVLALPLLAGSYEPVRAYWKDVALSCAVFGALLLILARFTAAAERITTLVERYNVAVLSVLVGLLAVAATFFVFDNVPHVSDEVAYEFQAKTLALGRLWLQTPQDVEFFTFIHTIVDGDKWYGIMNPGWPALLALGVRAGAPWLVNPILAAATLLVFFAAFRRLGYSTLETRIAVLLIAISPFVLFLAATSMSHTANLFFFGVFLWSWAGILQTGQLRYGLLAGVALAINLLIRPVDGGVVALPFCGYLAYKAVRERRYLWSALVTALIAALGILASRYYNYLLTGDASLMPMTKYFVDRNPAERFGLGFGADMGTKMHGPEWPGYLPIDAVRVTSYRLAEVLRDFHRAPVILLGFLLLPFTYAPARKGEWHRLLLLSGVCLVGIYIFHFYHGIAYGSRHYFLAVPAFAVAIARPLAAWLTSPQPNVVRWARAGLAAGLIYAVSLPYIALLPEYSFRYRGASGVVREAVKSNQLSNAIVFVSDQGWGWKSAFPLNNYPLAEQPVIFAKDLGPQNTILMRRFSGRDFYRLEVGRRDRIDLRRITPAE